MEARISRICFGNCCKVGLDGINGLFSKHGYWLVTKIQLFLFYGFLFTACASFGRSKAPFTNAGLTFTCFSRPWTGGTAIFIVSCKTQMLYHEKVCPNHDHQSVLYARALRDRRKCLLCDLQDAGFAARS